MKIVIGNDHAAVQLKNVVKEYVESLGHEVTDFGIAEGERIDYPEMGERVGLAVAKKEYDCGILICGTGVGISIAANKVRGIRAAVCGDIYSAQMAKCHNNANVITMGGRVIGDVVAVEIVKAWLGAEYEGGRHDARLEKIAEIEREN